jgi:hypothetical protein
LGSEWNFLIRILTIGSDREVEAISTGGANTISFAGFVRFYVGSLKCSSLSANPAFIPQRLPVRTSVPDERVAATIQERNTKHVLPSEDVA